MDDGTLSPLAFQVQPVASAPDGNRAMPAPPTHANGALVWLQDCDMRSAGEPDTGHLVAGMDGSTILCLHSRQTGRVIGVTVFGADQSTPQGNIEFSLNAASVAAVAITRPEQEGVMCRDLLVLQPDGRLAVHAGPNLVLYVDLDNDAGHDPATYDVLLNPTCMLRLSASAIIPCFDM
jgi:hypothetical protein